MTLSFENQLRDDLNRAAGTTNIPAVPLGVVGGRTRHTGHRVAIAALATGVVMGVGVPVAAATGGLDAFTQAFGWSQSTPLAATGTGSELLRLTSGGKTLQVMRAGAQQGATCFSVVDTAAAKTAPPVIASCSAIPTSLAELASTTDANGSDDLIAAPGAALIQVTTNAGTRSVAVAQGISYVHITAAEVAGPVDIASLSASRSPLQRITLHDGGGSSAATGQDAPATQLAP